MAQKKKYLQGQGIELLKNKAGEEGILITNQEEGTMMVRVGRKMATSKEKVETHQDQEAQDARHAKMSSQLQVKSYQAHELEQAVESSSASSGSSSSSSDSDESSSDDFGFGRSKQKSKQKNTAAKTAKPKHRGAVSSAPSSQKKAGQTNLNIALNAASTDKKEDATARTVKLIDTANAALQALTQLSVEALWTPTVGSREREVSSKLSRAEHAASALGDLENPPDEAAPVAASLEEACSRVRFLTQLFGTLHEDGGTEITIQDKDNHSFIVIMQSYSAAVIQPCSHQCISHESPFMCHHYQLSYHTSPHL